MNLQKIRDILAADLFESEKETAILRVIADDKKAIPTILEMLSYERETKGTLIKDLNFQLSRAHCAIVEPKLNKEKFVQDEIMKFYIERRDQVGHCFINIDKKEPA